MIACAFGNTKDSKPVGRIMKMTWTQETTLSDYYENVYRIHRHTGRSEKTINDFRIALNRFRVFFEESGRDIVPRLADLTDDNLAGFLSWMVNDKERAPETANKYAASIKAVWRYAKRKKVIDHAPDVDALTVPKHARKTWTPEQFDQLLSAAEEVPGYVGPVPAGVFWKALILTITNTASRINAVMKITISDVEFDRGIIVLRHGNVKDNADLRLPLLPATADAIRDLMKYMRFVSEAGPDIRVFRAWPYDQKGDYWSALRNHYKKILAAAKLPSKRRDLFHCLRAFTVTRITEKFGIKAAQAFCDHSSEAVTRAYIDQQQAGESLNIAEVFPQFTRQTPPPNEPPPEAFSDRPRLRVFQGDPCVAG